MRKLSLFMLMAVGLLISGNAGANTLTVGTTGSGATYSTIASAISAASAGDEIQLLTDMTENVSITKTNLTFSGDKIIYGKVSSTLSSCTITLAGISVINNVAGDAFSFTTNGKSLNIIVAEQTTNVIQAPLQGCDGICKFYSNLSISGQGSLNISGANSGIHIGGANLTISAPNLKVSGPANKAVLLQSPGTVSITAGTYSDEVQVPNGYACVDNGDGTYTVKKASLLANGQVYGSMEEAVAAVNAGDEIKLVANLTGDCSVNKNVIINLNDYNISGTITADGAEVTLYTREYDMNATAASTIDGISEINGGKILFREGTYNFDTEGRLAPDMYSTTYAGYYAVAPHIAQIGSNYYLCLREAYNSIAENGEGTITLLRDAAVNESDLAISKKSIVIDLNGHDIYLNSCCFRITTMSSLTLIGTGTCYGDLYGFILWGNIAQPHTMKTILNIGKNVTIETKEYSVFINCVNTSSAQYAHGVKVLVEGKVHAGTAAFYIQGNVYNAEDCPEITIANTAVWNGAYAAGFGKWIINGGEMTSDFEMRAGELTINDGTFTSSSTYFGGFKPNGSGSTCSGAAIICSQHTTKLATIININGGTFTGPVAVAQGNPQMNDLESVSKVQVNLNGGYFFGTEQAVLNDNIRRLYGKGGFYNTDPIDIVATGYKCYPITADDYPTEYAAGYRYRIGEIDVPGNQETTVNDGDWKLEATTVWEQQGGAGTVPTDETPVVIENDKQVIVTTPATAYSVTLGTGTSKLTVKKTGRLMVGAGGFNGTTEQSFIVEDGGQMAISPAQAEYQPEATVTFVADWARRKASADSKEAGSLVAEDLYWQHIATPLSNGVAPTPSETGVSYVNTWNLVNGWTSATWANVVTPFVGYQVSSINKSTDDKITYTFKGKLVGNHVDPMNFTRIGFSFFGNSYLAPIDIRELLTCLETKSAIEPTVLLYNSETGVYEAINRASYFIPGTKAEIQPMQGFFVFSENATNVDFDYRKAVWDAFCAKANSGVVVPTAPKMQENPFSAIACIDVQAENGAKDRVMLFEGDELSDAEDKGYDARKMMTSGMNIYAKGSYADLAILATNNLQGSELILKTDANTNYTLSFANIKGEYALYDALTGRTINMTESETYEFQAQANATITDRFYVVEAAKVPTQIDNVNAKAGSCKFMKNGVMFIERNNKVYNAQGQIVK